MGKKMTRKEKLKLSEKNICWKCKKQSLKKDKNLIICENCGFTFTKL